jgi:Fe-S-cluster containining protein
MHLEEKHDHRRDGALRRGDSMRFRCHAGLDCFTTCCRDVNIFLSPYDILRMKKRLGISSTEFLQRYTISLIPEVSGFPVILLKMEEETNRACPFITPRGCSIYEDRPWACRMFPLDQVDRPGEYRFITDPSFCLGMKEGEEQTVESYLDGQGLAPYNESERLLGRIASDPRFSKAVIRNPKLQEMCRMALYDLDRFRRFVLKSRFLEIFEMDGERRQKIAKDDMELLKLAHQWLEFGLVAGDTLRMREDLLQGAKREE